MARSEQVEISHIHLDGNNPRIKHLTGVYDTLNESRIALALGAGGDSEGEATAQDRFRQLKLAIKESGGVVQPIILKYQGHNSFLCIEGNTRVVIYRQLAKENPGGLWSTIQAIVHDELDEVQAHEIRLQVHLVGPRPWPAYAKAKYLCELQDNEMLPLKEIIRICGETEQAVKTDTQAYRDMEMFYRPVVAEDGGTFKPARFSAFREMQRIKSDLYDADKDETDFSRWVYNDLIHPLNTVRNLPKILQNQEATKVLLRKGAKEAGQYLDREDARNRTEVTTSVQDASIEELAVMLQRRINGLSFEDTEDIANAPESSLYVELDYVREAITQLMDASGPEN